MKKYRFIKMPLGQDAYIIEGKRLQKQDIRKTVIETDVDLNESAYFEEIPMATVRAPLNELKNRKNLRGCEIGVYLGHHALAMFEHLDMKMLYLIDPYPNPETTDYKWFSLKNSVAQAAKKHAAEKLEPYTDKGVARWIYQRSDEAHTMIQDDSLDFVYVDGDHRTEYCLSDIKLYLPKLKKGGLMGGHDWHDPRVKKAVKIFLEEHPKYKLLGDWWFIK